MIRLSREIDPANLADLTSDGEAELPPAAPPMRDTQRPRLVLLDGGAERAA
ncbi:MAG: hypothetical protein ABI950_10145 [Solirubrobacteraceae bacterium]